MSKENIILEDFHTIDGTYSTTLTEKFKQRKGWERPNPKEIYSYIPGTITSIEVKVGQKVEKGETLLTFNAMKMSNTYGSPISGTVAKIYVEAGQAVAKGIMLVEFE